MTELQSVVWALVSVMRKLPVLERAGKVFLDGLRRAVKVILRPVVDVDGGNIEGCGDCFFVDVAAASCRRSRW